VSIDDCILRESVGHVITADAGLSGHDESYADITALQPVARSRLLRRRGLLTRTDIDRVGRQIAIYLGL